MAGKLAREDADVFRLSPSTRLVLTRAGAATLYRGREAFTLSPPESERFARAVLIVRPDAARIEVGERQV